MPNVDVHTWTWSGFPGAPGISTFVARADATHTPSDIHIAIHNFFVGVAPNLSREITVSPAPTFKTLDEQSGILISEGPFSSLQPAVVGLNAGAFAGPAGAVVNWLTATVGTRRSMRGRTFIVPLSVEAYEHDGTLQGPSLTGLRNAAAQLVVDTTPSFVVWRRPRPAQVAPKPPKPAVVGKAGPIIASKVPDLVTVLRTRR